MKMRRVDNSVEKAITTGMVVSTQYLKDVRAIYAPDLLAIPYARIVAQWCLDYYERYAEAPGRYIGDIFESHRRNGLAADQAELIEDFLAGLSDEYEHAEAGKFNAAYLLDQTELRFEARNQELLIQDIKALHAKGDFRAAEELLTGYKRISRPTSDGCEPLSDMAVIQRAFDEDDSRILFRLPGALGELVGPVEREDFIGILGPEKRGKSWRLLDIAIRALRVGCNVAYFDAGDMSEDQIVRRLHTRVSGLSPKYWGRSLRPIIDCAHNQNDRCRRRERKCRRGCTEERVDEAGRTVYKRLAFKDVLGYATCTACAKDNNPNEWQFWGSVWYEEVDTERLSWQKAYELGKRIADRSRKRFKLSCHANSTLSVAGMRAQLDRWQSEDGFVADVVLADYFDIFDEEPGTKSRDNQARLIHDVRWRAGRRLTQEMHCALITATQADASSYDQKSLKLKNFSESKTKYAHVTKFWALNQTADEKRDGIMRMATLIAREDNFDIIREVAIGQDLRHGQPYLFSYWDQR